MAGVVRDVRYDSSLCLWPVCLTDIVRQFLRPANLRSARASSLVEAAGALVEPVTSSTRHSLSLTCEEVEEHFRLGAIPHFSSQSTTESWSNISPVGEGGPGGVNNMRAEDAMLRRRCHEFHQFCAHALEALGRGRCAPLALSACT